MFTGIITQMGKILSIQPNEQGASLVVLAQWPDVQIGESIAIDGVCLTVVEMMDTAEGLRLQFDISPETYQLTTFSSLQQSAQVNMERALCIGDRLGGHFVSGHIDQTAKLVMLEKQTEFTRMIFTGIDKTNTKNIFKKGSVAVNGVSLTVNNVDKDSFEVMLIPETLRKTNFLKLKMGDKVNIEFDMIVKIVNNHCIS